MKNQSLIISLSLIALALIAYAGWMFMGRPSSSYVPTTQQEASFEPEQGESTDISSDEALMQQPETTQDTSLTTIESELNGTVILEEDFADTEE